MLPARAAAVFHRVVQNGHDHLVVALAAVKPAGDHLHQLLLFRMEQNGVDDAAADDAGHKGAADIVRGAEVKRAVDIGAAGLRTDHDGRNFVDPAAAAHFLQHAEAIQLRHHDVQQQRGNFAVIDLQRRDGLTAVAYLDDLVIQVQRIGQNGAVELRVVRDHQFFSFHSVKEVSSPKKVSPSLPGKRRDAGASASERPRRSAWPHGRPYRRRCTR